jgi:hypothetical protein
MSFGKKQKPPAPPAPPANVIVSQTPALAQLSVKPSNNGHWSAHRLFLPPVAVIRKQKIVPTTSSSPSPFPRYGYALPSTATANGDLFLFGGLVREASCNDLYLLSTRDLSATLLETGGEIPTPRVGHASALVSSTLIVWGGDTRWTQNSKATDKQDDGFYLLNLGEHIFC